MSFENSVELEEHPLFYKQKNNNFGYDDLQNIAQELSKSNKGIIFPNITIDSECIGQFEEEYLNKLIELLSKYKYLKSLKLNLYNTLLNQDLHHIQLNKLSLSQNLTFLSIDLGENNIDSNTCEGLSKELSTLSNLISLQLNLNENQIGNQGIISIFKSISNLNNLEILKYEIGHGDIGDGGIKEIGKYIKLMINLTTLHLVMWENYFTNEGITVFGREVAQCKKLQVLLLNLAEDILIGCEGLNNFFQSISNLGSLLSLSLDSTYIQLDINFYNNLYENLKKMRNLNTLHFINLQSF